MYEGPIVYESQVMDYFTMGISFLIVLAIVTFLVASLGKIFQKAEYNFWCAFIPIYNMFILIRLVHLSVLYILLLLIPIVNIFALYKISHKLAVVFKKNDKFKWGLFFLPFIFYPILAFSNDRYIGINEEKVEEIILQDLVREKVEYVPASTVLKSDTNVNIGTSTAQVANNSKILQADTSILEQPKPITIEYMECPKCKNKVKKGVSVCFICGHKFE